MTNRPHHRASSIASSASASASHADKVSASPPSPPSNANADGPHAARESTAPLHGHPSILQPRVAVVLDVPPPWHPWLFALRLCSILPALWWGLPCALQLLLRLLPGDDRVLVVRATKASSFASSSSSAAAASSFSSAHQPSAPHGEDAVEYALTEAMLATIWCFACGYLSFFFADCLMSRWLINYTPQATIVRLLSINAVNAYLTLTVLSLTGGFQDPRLLLPGWIGIATVGLNPFHSSLPSLSLASIALPLAPRLSDSVLVQTLTVCYHITHQKINIRKETSTSINVFSIASYITMVTLLIHMHSYLADYPTMPIISRARQLWQDAKGLLVRLQGAIVERSEL
ncbi:hypothetical protein RJ55_05997 [Drechmeria coniospora]|nr:hypothetical protein RJ55_05997 [Drechmeria coniospora]